MRGLFVLFPPCLIPPALCCQFKAAFRSHLLGAEGVSGPWRERVGPSASTRTTEQIDARPGWAPVAVDAKAGDYIRLSLIGPLIDISVLWFRARPALSRHATARARRRGAEGILLDNHRWRESYWNKCGVGAGPAKGAAVVGSWEQQSGVAGGTFGSRRETISSCGDVVRLGSSGHCWVQEGQRNTLMCRFQVILSNRLLSA